MKIFAISVLSLLVVLAIAGCNPVGMDKTRVYVTGHIFTDGSMNQGAEDIGLTTVGCQETYVTMTDSTGLFWLEIQFYPELGEGSYGGTSGSVTFGLTAHGDSTSSYYYGGDKDYTFTVFGGDTLTMYHIDLTMFTPGKAGR